MATNKKKDGAGTRAATTTTRARAPRDRLEREALVAALEAFAALATAYADASDADLASDHEAEAAVRAVVERLESVCPKRSSAAEPRIMLAMMNGLKEVYAHVRALDERAVSKPVPSKRIRYGGTWKTADDRRGELWKVIAPWIPDFTEDELDHVDLTAAQIRERQGPKLAAQSVVAFLFDKGRASKSDEGRAQRGRMLRNWERDGIEPAGEPEREKTAPKVFGSPLSLERTIKFALDALGG